jgi:hypothetical protein
VILIQIENKWFVCCYFTSGCLLWQHATNEHTGSECLIIHVWACPSFLGSGFSLQVLGSPPLRYDGLWAFRYNPSRKQQ